MYQPGLLLRRALPFAAWIGIVAGCAGAASPSASTPFSAAPSLVAPSPRSAVPSTSSSPTAPSPAAAALPPSGSIEPGTHRVTNPFPVSFDLAVEDGWSVYAVDGCCVLLAHDRFRPPGLVMFSAWTIDAVYTDPCRHVLGPTIGPGVDALVAALRAVPALGATEPEAAEIDGRHATHVALETPDADRGSDCVNDEFAMWAFGGEETRYIPPGYGDGVDELWILEVDGTRIVLDGSLSEATDADRAELSAIVGSVRFR